MDIIAKIKAKTHSDNGDVLQLTDKALDIIKKWRKLIQIADQSADGWEVVDEYVSDKLASEEKKKKRGSEKPEWQLAVIESHLQYRTTTTHLNGKNVIAHLQRKNFSHG